jgi:UTP-glucose-1-phosphate uridylyltransferase
MEEEYTISNINNIICDIFKNNNNKNNYIGMDLNEIMNILSDKMNNIKIINDDLVKGLCTSIILHCKKHNSMINEWFDEQYNENLKTLKQNNEDYLKLSNDFEIKSLISIKKK